MSSLNKASIIGNVGKDPDIRVTQSGSRIASFSIASTETWKDREGKRQERTEWIKIVVMNDALVGIIEKYVRKGSKLYIEGAIQTRKWTGDDGRDNYSTEVVLRQFNGQIILLDSKQGESVGNVNSDDYLNDEVPF